MNMKYDFVGIGDITTDAFIDLKDVDVHTNHGVKELCFRFGDKIAFENVVEVPAVGNSANASVAAAKLGLDSALIAGVGDDFNGKVCLATLQKQGVSSQYVKVFKGKHTNYHYVLRFGVERTILVKQYPYPYNMPNFDILPNWLYFSSISQEAVRFHHEVAQFVSNTNVKLAFQPGTFQIKLGYEKLKDLYAVVDIFFCNKQEAMQILNSSNTNIKELLKEMRKLGIKTVIITDGPNGAYAYDGAKFYSLPMYPDIAPPTDRTGAGDAFSSTVVAFLAKGASLEDAMLRGPINSMSVVQYIGAQKGLLEAKALEAYLKDAPSDYRVTIERDI